MGFLARAEPSVAQMPMPTLVVIDYAEAAFDLVALLAVGSLAAGVLRTRQGEGPNERDSVHRALIHR